ncbi:hypothetical protein H6F96_19570 [Microcoleus sp. FACHB-53]|nr:hypothetical protein [Microcoleus sp. FACHB-53]
MELKLRSYKHPDIAGSNLKKIPWRPIKFGSKHSSDRSKRKINSRQRSSNEGDRTSLRSPLRKCKEKDDGASLSDRPLLSKEKYRFSVNR